MAISSAKHIPVDSTRPLEVVADPTPTEARDAVPGHDGAGDPIEPQDSWEESTPTVRQVAVPVAHAAPGATAAARAPGPAVPHVRRQVAPYVDLYQPTWLNGLIRLLILDEHGAMPRTVQAQVGFASMLMGVQFCLDMLAWILGFRWVFVNAMGPFGWVLAVVFAFLVSSIILIFERFVITADVSAGRLPLFLNPAILMRVFVVILFATVTAIPVEMLVFNDVIQGRLNGELQGIRESARQQLRGDFHKDVEDLSVEEGNARKRLKDETPTVSLTELSTPKLDERIKQLQAELDKATTDMKLEERGWRDGHASGHGPEWLRVNTLREGLEKQLAETKAMRQADLDTRSAGNVKAESSAADRHFQELTRISERYEPRKRELEKKLREVDRMGDAELSKATRREFAVVDGFARRFKILNDLEKEDPMYATTKYAVRVLFVAFGLLVLTTKALFNKPTKLYFSGKDPLAGDDQPS
jgi:hypothetical protein